MKPIFSVAIGKKRDILLAQVRARQLCRMLGFAPLEQARVVCLIFEVACGRLGRGRPVTLSFQVQDRRFEVYCGVSTQDRTAQLTGRLVLSLSLPQADLTVEDVFWAMDRIRGLSKPDLFGEIRQQNNDLLRALAELQTSDSSSSPRRLQSQAA